MSIVIALFLAQAAATTPSAEAEGLGVRLARAGTLAAILPAMGAKETEDLLAAHRDLPAADQAALRATAQRTLDAGSAQITAAFGRAYARRLSVAELRTLVAQAESPAARKWRQVLPAAMAEAMGGVGAFDFKRETLAAFCRETGKLCAPAPAAVK